MRCELRIHDTWEEKGNILVPFASLLGSLLRLFPGEMHIQEWTILSGAYGYGARVCEIEDSLEGRASVTVDARELLARLLEGEERFDNVRIQPVGGSLEFGVRDSTFLFVRGDAAQLSAIAALYRNAEMILVH
jgi:hypothetical protein